MTSDADGAGAWRSGVWAEASLAVGCELERLVLAEELWRDGEADASELSVFASTSAGSSSVCEAVFCGSSISAWEDSLARLRRRLGFGG